MDDEWELPWVRVPEGTHLSNSSGTAGTERDLLREDATNKLLGPTESRAAHIEDLPSACSPDPYGYDDKGLTAQQRQLAGQLGEALGAATAEILKEVVLPWARTRLRNAWGRRPNRLRRSSRQSAPADPGTAMLDTGPSVTLDVALAQPRVRMTGAEYESNF